MRKPKLEKFDFSKVDSENFSEAIGVPLETANSILDDVQEEHNTAGKYSKFCQKLDEEYTKPELIITLMALLKK